MPAARAPRRRDNGFTDSDDNDAMTTPAPASPASGDGARPPHPSLRERFDALRNVPPFLREIWRASPSLTLATLGLRLVRAFLPVATLYVGKLIIDEALRLSRPARCSTISAPHSLPGSSTTFCCCSASSSGSRSARTCSGAW